MHISGVRLFKLVLLLILLSLLTGCAAGSPKWTLEAPAGFWQGLWHGMISVVTFIINLFNHDIKVYEVNNNGGWYNFGFLLGVIAIWGSGPGAGLRLGRRRQAREWKEEVAAKVERKVLQRLKEWAEAEGETEWEELGKKIEEKLKRKIREWAEEE